MIPPRRWSSPAHPPGHRDARWSRSPPAAQSVGALTPEQALTFAHKTIEVRRVIEPDGFNAPSCSKPPAGASSGMRASRGTPSSILDCENSLSHDLAGFERAVRVCHLLERKRRTDRNPQVAGIEVSRCLLENPRLALSMLRPSEH